MILHYSHRGKSWKADLSKPMDVAIPMGVEGPRAWYVAPPQITPVMENGFVGSIALGGKVNFFNVHFNPHGNGTHTETLGHIDPNHFPISQWNGPFIAHALLISVEPTVIEKELGKDSVILWNQIEEEVEKLRPTALIIRTLPNRTEKWNCNYSNSHFPYLEATIGDNLNRLGVLHLLVDLPSVDREQDGGLLECHHAFWGFPENPRYDATITELIFVKDEVKDGLYCLFLQPPGFQNDAAPSRPLIYPTTTLAGDIEESF